MIKYTVNTWIWLVIFYELNTIICNPDTNLSIDLPTSQKITSYDTQNFTKCPIVEEDPEEDILLPHPTDCTKFYKCSFGRKHVIQCPDNLYFNLEARYCDWRRNVNCTNSENNENSTPIPPSGENTCPAVDEDPEEDILLPHEYDCTVFYKCSHGRNVALNCPPGLYFNRHVNYCDWPYFANCTNVCPDVEEDPENEILFPNETDCSKFYKCSFGQKIDQNCPGELLYNHKKRRCDWDDNVTCYNNF